MKKTITTTTERTVDLCDRCGEALDLEEADNPHRDEDDDGNETGEPICDECYHENYEFTCCCCSEYGHVSDQHKMLVVFEETHSMGGPERTVAPGIYRIKGRPYYGDMMIGPGWLYGDKLERIADVNPDMDGDGYPCGHLCAACQENVKAQFVGKCRQCGKKKADCLRIRMGSWKDFEAHEYQWTRPRNICAACRKAYRGAWRRVAGKGVKS